MVYVVGLYEAKTTTKLTKELGKCRRQAILEYLAANAMRATREWSRRSKGHPCLTNEHLEICFASGPQNLSFGVWPCPPCSTQAGGGDGRRQRAPLCASRSREP